MIIKPDDSRPDFSPEMAEILCFCTTGNRMGPSCPPTFAK